MEEINHAVISSNFQPIPLNDALDTIVYDAIRAKHPEIARLILMEEGRQDEKIELIASENFTSPEVRYAMASCLTNKYAEGKPYHRYYGGCEYIDELEAYCQEQWKLVFKTDYHVNVQPHSGANANLAAFLAFLQPGDTVLSANLAEGGGHLSHGSPANISGKMWNIIPYGVTSDGCYDYKEIERLALEYHPKLIIAGASAYSRIIDFQQFRDIAHECGAYLMVDMAHIAGLIAAGDHPSPFGLADVITTTTHKTLRGPRGGLIFCKPEFAKQVDSAVFPGSQGGPLEHIIAAKAVCAEEDQTEEYYNYIHQVVKNCKAMADTFMSLGYKVVSDGTDNHLFLVDLRTKFDNIDGKEAQDYLDSHGISLNKNTVPGETRSPFKTSGLRIGTAPMTTKGWTEDNFVECANQIDKLLTEFHKNKEN